MHRDIKPENIMVRADGYVKLLDFGLARLLPAPAARDGTTVQATRGAGVILGTPRYMSPEQARGEPATSASDVFSLGVVLYELATGTHPFEAESTLGMLHAIASRADAEPRAARAGPARPARAAAAPDAREARGGAPGSRRSRGGADEARPPALDEPVDPARWPVAATSRAITICRRSARR